MRSLLDAVMLQCCNAAMLRLSASALAQIDRPPQPCRQVRYRSTVLVVIATPIFARSIVEQGIFLTRWFGTRPEGSIIIGFKAHSVTRHINCTIDVQVLERSLTSSRRQTEI